MNRTIRISAIVALLLITAHRLPAPIQEVPESPTPAPEQSAKPKPKHEAKPVASENSQSQTKRNPFDGTWVGKIDQGAMGVNQFTAVISGSGTLYRDTSKWGTGTWNATCDGKTMRWTWKGKVLRGSCTFTPNPDGKTAIMTSQSAGGIFGINAFNSTTTFYKISQ